MKMVFWRRAVLLPLLALGACDAPSPGPASAWKEELERGDQKENVNLLVAHCVAWSGAGPLAIQAKMQAEDFGPATDTEVEVKWDFGDSQSKREVMPRPGYPRGRPIQYRFDSKVEHVYERPGSYRVVVEVRNGSRSSMCGASVTLLPPGKEMSHPQG